MIHGHHIVHPAKEWTLRPEAQRIRETKSLIPRLDPEVHNRLHRNSSPIPVLGYHALQIVQREFEPTEFVLETVDALEYAIEQAGKHPRAYRVERGVARLAIEAIEMQRPFLEEALQAPEDLVLFNLSEIPGYEAA
jgi:hypothetical protein